MELQTKKSKWTLDKQLGYGGIYFAKGNIIFP